MASERGTIPRGAGIDQQPAWMEPTAPSARRMPSAPRERKPALAALAVLLVALGALGSGFLVLSSGHRVGAIEITQSLGAGQQIPLSAMREVEIASDSGVSYVPWADAAQVARVFAATAIPADTLLTAAMTAGSDKVTNSDEQVGLSLKQGQAPAGLQIGDTVQALVVGAAAGCGVTTGEALGTGEVTSVSGGTSGDGNESLTLAVPVGQDATQLACAAADSQVAVILMPANSGDGGSG
jgi:hypothetical protein